VSPSPQEQPQQAKPEQSSEQPPSQPVLRLHKPLSAEALAELFKRLTGRDPTPEEIERARQKLATSSAEGQTSVT